MTDNEIIKFLQSKQIPQCGDKEYTADEEYEAYQMAIKALEQQPKILDTIDFAIDASNGDTNYFVGFRNGLRYAKSLIDGEEPQYESCADQQPCDDAISRKAVDELSKELVHTTRDKADFLCNFWEGLRKLPSVTPNQKIGHWIAVENEEMETIGYYCSECDLPMETENQTRFCPNCGAKMQESEEA